MDTYRKMSAFSAPSRIPFHHVYVKTTQHDLVHTLRETAADNREACVTLRITNTQDLTLICSALNLWRGGPLRRKAGNSFALVKLILTSLFALSSEAVWAKRTTRHLSHFQRPTSATFWNKVINFVSLHTRWKKTVQDIVFCRFFW